jgi:hypothetical protein
MSQAWILSIPFAARTTAPNCAVVHKVVVEYAVDTLLTSSNPESVGSNLNSFVSPAANRVVVVPCLPIKLVRRLSDAVDDRFALDGIGP